MPESTDRIVKHVHIRAPRSRVWRAIADPEAFGAWFGARFDGPFEPGKRVDGRIVDPPGYEEAAWDIVIDRVEPEHYFSFRWHPYAIEPGIDYSGEPRTLIEFLLEEADGGTLLTVIESGFETIPLERRARAFEANEGGWAIQVERVREYVEAGRVAPIG